MSPHTAALARHTRPKIAAITGRSEEPKVAILALMKTFIDQANARTPRATRDRSSSWCGYRFRAFQISSEGHRRAQSSVTNGKRLGELTGGRGSIKSSMSKPFARRSRTHSP